MSKLVRVTGHSRILRTGKRALVKPHVRSSKRGVIAVGGVGVGKRVISHTEVKSMKDEAETLKREYDKAVHEGDTEKRDEVVEKSRGVVKWFMRWLEAHSTALGAAMIVPMGVIGAYASQRPVGGLAHPFIIMGLLGAFIALFVSVISVGEKGENTSDEAKRRLAKSRRKSAEATRRLAKARRETADIKHGKHPVVVVK